MSRPVTIVELPIGCGAPYVGIEQGPAEICASNGARALDDQHDVSRVGVECPSTDSPPVEGITATIDRVSSVVDSATGFPIFLGGDHTASIATVNGVAEEVPGLLWVDAHADFNTIASSPSGNIHGMVVSSLLGDGPLPKWNVPALDEENIAIVGLSSVDDEERERLSNSDISTYSMTDIESRGFTTVLSEAWGVISDGTDSVHVSLDMDVFEPTLAPGVSVPEAGGLSYEDGQCLATFLSEQPLFSSLDIVELNPLRDQHGKTATLAGEILNASLS